MLDDFGFSLASSLVGAAADHQTFILDLLASLHLLHEMVMELCCFRLGGGGGGGGSM